MLLVDRKPLYMTLEDIRFDMISEIDYNSSLLDSTIKILTPSRNLIFTSWSQHRLRNILTYTQQRVMELRQQYMVRQFQPQQPQQTAGPLVGGLLMRGNTGPQGLPLNPYTRVPMLMRRRLYPKFY
jgi:hypothetical protein